MSSYEHYCTFTSNDVACCLSNDVACSYIDVWCMLVFQCGLLLYVVIQINVELVLWQLRYCSSASIFINVIYYYMYTFCVIDTIQVIERIK